MKQNKTPDIDKITEYFNKYDDICDFIISRKVFKTLLFWFSLFSAGSALLALWGGSAYINYVVKDNIEKRIAEAIDQEKTYLKKRNELIYQSDQAIVTGDIAIYDYLKQIESNAIEDMRIRIAANSEIKKIELFFSSEISDKVFPEEALIYNDEKGNKFNGNNISTENLIKLFNNSSNFGERTTILNMLSDRKESSIPLFLFETAKSSKHLRIRYVSMRSLQGVMKDYPDDQFDYKYFENKLKK